MVFFFDTTAKKINTFVYLGAPLTFSIYYYLYEKKLDWWDSTLINVSAFMFVIPSIISYMINTISLIIIDRYIKGYIINTILKIIIFILVLPTVFFALIALSGSEGGS